jgi:hypothetical protein
MKKNSKGEIIFDDDDELIKLFRPNLSPEQIFKMGSFGGGYWRPIYSSVVDKNLKNQHLEFDFLKNIPNNKLTNIEYDKNINKYKVKCGSSLEFWESKNWIHKQDPYGWVQWYCRFYNGRRSNDDERQIKRWLAFAGPKGRFKNQLINNIKNNKTKYNDINISPVIRQSLQHWAYKIKVHDLD